MEPPKEHEHMGGGWVRQEKTLSIAQTRNRPSQLCGARTPTATDRAATHVVRSPSGHAFGGQTLWIGHWFDGPYGPSVLNDNPDDGFPEGFIAFHGWIGGPVETAAACQRPGIPGRRNRVVDSPVEVVERVVRRR